MRCKKHLSDNSSSIGVCSTCLRDRLFSLIQNYHSTPILNPNPDPPPPPLVFPRSVSPYRGPTTQIQRFFTTPLVDPTTQRRKKGFFSRIFGSRSDKPDRRAGPTATSTSSSYTTYYGKGMSPERRWDELESPARSFPRPSPGRVKPSPSRPGFAFCLSPLVRPSPARQWSFTAEEIITNNNKPHLSNASSFCANRSRKLADLGRLNPNR